MQVTGAQKIALDVVFPIGINNLSLHELKKKHILIINKLTIINITKTIWLQQSIATPLKHNAQKTSHYN